MPATRPTLGRREAVQSPRSKPSNRPSPDIRVNMVAHSVTSLHPRIAPLLGFRCSARATTGRKEGVVDRGRKPFPNDFKYLSNGLTTPSRKMFGSVALAHLNQHSWDGNLLADKPRDFFSAEPGRRGFSRNRSIPGAAGVLGLGPAFGWAGSVGVLPVLGADPAGRGPSPVVSEKTSPAVPLAGYELHGVEEPGPPLPTRRPPVCGSERSHDGGPDHLAAAIDFAVRAKAIRGRESY
jgi:hypothetical protein